MPLLEEGKTILDLWTVIADESVPLESGVPSILPFARLRQDGAVPDGHNGKLGVLLASDTRIEDVAPYLDRLALIAVEFPKFRDGRSFTLARSLRERYGYTGEIRAVGNVLPDQYDYLRRCGVDTVALPEDADMAAWGKALDLYHISYQAAITDDPTVSFLRRHIAPASPKS